MPLPRAPVRAVAIVAVSCLSSFHSRLVTETVSGAPARRCALAARRAVGAEPGAERGAVAGPQSTSLCTLGSRKTYNLGFNVC